MKKCSLRANIEETLRQHSDPEAAAVAVCLLLEDSIGLYGNGWFDGDQVLEKAIGAE
jgi:hypothetical protein